MKGKGSEAGLSAQLNLDTKNPWIHTVSKDFSNIRSSDLLPSVSESLHHELPVKATSGNLL